MDTLLAKLNNTIVNDRIFNLADYVRPDENVDVEELNSRIRSIRMKYKYYKTKNYETIVRKCKWFTLKSNFTLYGLTNVCYYKKNNKIRHEVYRLENGYYHKHYDINGNIEAEYWFNLNNILHREDGPSKIIYNKYSIKQKDTYYINGKIHRDDGPAIIIHFNNFIREIWYNNGKRHRIDGPAKIEYHNKDIIEHECWYQNNEKHRLDGPAMISRSKNGNITYESWWENNRHHRLNKPSSIVYDTIYNFYFWHEYGKRYRSDGGPIFVKCDKNNKILYEYYWSRESYNHKYRHIVNNNMF